MSITLGEYKPSKSGPYSAIQMIKHSSGKKKICNCKEVSSKGSFSMRKINPSCDPKEVKSGMLAWFLPKKQRHTLWIYFYSFKANLNVATEFLHKL